MNRLEEDIDAVNGIDQDAEPTLDPPVPGE